MTQQEPLCPGGLFVWTWHPHAIRVAAHVCLCASALLLSQVLHAGAEVTIGPVDTTEGQDEEHEKSSPAYRENWVPFLLYGSGDSLLSPESNISIAYPEQLRGTVTGLASAPAKDHVICAVGGTAGSRLLRVGVDGSDQPDVIADASDIGEESFFHSPIAVSPDGRWVLVTVSTGRLAALADFANESARTPSWWSDMAGDLWLVDCTRRELARELVASCRMVSCAWGPSARWAVCNLVTKGGRQSIMLLDAEQARVHALAEGSGHPIWSLSDPRLRVVRRRDTLTCDLETGATVAQAVVYPSSYYPADATWSYDGLVASWVQDIVDASQIRIADLSGVGRAVRVTRGPVRLLGWSQNPLVLAYLLSDGTLHFAFGPFSAPAREHLLSVLPTYLGGSQMRIADYLAPQTSVSPVKLSLETPVFGAWVTGKNGPCFVYAESASETSQTIAAIAFRTLSLKRDFKIDLTGNPREQVITSLSTSNLVLFCAGLARYANDHNGLLPPHAEGAALVQDMQGYCDPSLFRSPYGADDDIRLRLLLPGANLEELEEERDAHPERKLAVAELASDDGWTFTAYIEWIARDVYNNAKWDCIVPSIESARDE